ncbi:MAG: hypothetical protein GY757_07975, partial [bacterium]|nr:hypothetical protein [bacterium]
ALAGLADSAYLFYSHYKIYTDILYKSFCALTKAINCDTVSQSKYSIFLGLPLSVWGILGYFGFLSLICFARNMRSDEKYIWSLMLIGAFLFTLHSLILALLSIFLIHSYCIMCILSYLINFFLLFYAWIIRKRFEKTGLFHGLGRGVRCLFAKWKAFIPISSSFLIVVILLELYLPVYWKYTNPVLPSDIKQGVTSDGLPWIGAEDPELVIIEFTDYFCFQC